MPPENFEPQSPGKVAIYWDFENFHATIADRIHGHGAYRRNWLKAQPVFFQLEPVLEYAASFGDVIINKAYGNWQWFANYRDLLNIAGVDLIQIFPRGKNMKNSADIRLALDVVADIYSHPHISHIVVVSCDSDFISLAQKIKQAGKFIAGVGVSGFSNRFWVASCNEFKFFEALIHNESSASPEGLNGLSYTRSAATESTSEHVGLTAVENESVPTMVEARDALSRAMLQLVERRGENLVSKANLKTVIKRLMPSFDERIIRCRNFSDFILRCSDLVTVVSELDGGHVALVKYEAPSNLAFDQQAIAVGDASGAETPPGWTFEIRSDDSETDLDNEIEDDKIMSDQ